MTVPHISTSYGFRKYEPLRPHVIPTDPDAALIFAARIDRESDALLAGGQIHRAESLAHLALEARCRATGARA